MWVFFRPTQKCWRHLESGIHYIPCSHNTSLWRTMHHGAQSCAMHQSAPSFTKQCGAPCRIVRCGAMWMQHGASWCRVWGEFGGKQTINHSKTCVWPGLGGRGSDGAAMFLAIFQISGPGSKGFELSVRALLWWRPVPNPGLNVAWS